MAIRVSWTDEAGGQLVMGGELASPAEVAAAVQAYNASAQAELDAADVDTLLDAANRGNSTGSRFKIK